MRSVLQIRTIDKFEAGVQEFLDDLYCICPPPMIPRYRFHMAFRMIDDAQ